MKRILICAAAAWFLAGCGGGGTNDDHIVGPPPPPLERDSPQHTVEYYRVAWQSRDSTQIDSVLADDYQGTSTDIGVVTETLNFTKSDEVRAAHNMKLDADLIHVSVNLGPMSSWTRDSYPGDPPDWAVIVVQDPTILLSYSSSADVAVSPSSTSMTFKVKPTAVVGTDTTWQVVRWSEMHTGP